MPNSSWLWGTAFGVDGIPLEDAGKIRELSTLEEVRDYIRKVKKGGD
jgi:hypothetical protein